MVALPGFMNLMLIPSTDATDVSEDRQTTSPEYASSGDIDMLIGLDSPGNLTASGLASMSWSPSLICMSVAFSLIINDIDADTL